MTIKEYILARAARQGVPASGTFELTARCNLNCRMCYIRRAADDVAARAAEMTSNEWLRLGREAVDAGMTYLLLTGGEPMLRPDFCRIYREMAEMGVLILINTNATVISDEVIETFEKYPPEAVNITLYGMSEETYGELCGSKRGFSAAMEGISRLRGLGVRVNINTTFTRPNACDMDALAAFARENDIPIRSAAYVFPPVRGGCGSDEVVMDAADHGRLTARFDLSVLGEREIEERRKYLSGCAEAYAGIGECAEYSDGGCMAGRGSFWVSFDGRLMGCGMLPGISEDVRTQTFAEAWNSLRARLGAVMKPAKCARCAYAKVCNVCGAVIASLSGDETLIPRLCGAEHAVELTPELEERLARLVCRRTEAYVREFLK